MRGRSEHSLDDKGRVIIPQRFRDTLGPEFMLVTGPGPCLRIYPMSVFERMEDELASTDVLDEANEDKLMLQRLFYDGDVGSLDQQFRLTIPKPLRNWAELGKVENETVIIIGMGEKIELWSHGAWDAYKGGVDTRTTTLAGDRIREKILKAKSGDQ